MLAVAGGQDSPVIPNKGLFSLPFMTRAIERKRQQAESEALALLQELEREDAAAASDEDGLNQGANAQHEPMEAAATGRMSFGLPNGTAPQVSIDCSGAANNSNGMVMCRHGACLYHSGCHDLGRELVLVHMDSDTFQTAHGPMM